MRRCSSLWLAVFVAIVAVTPVWAFEFEMTGDYEYRLRYFGRTGDTDLFGKASLQDNGAKTFIGFAGPNIYGTGNLAPVVADASNTEWSSRAGMRITRGGFSRWGSDAFYNDSRLTFRPSFRINQALRLSAAYTVGGMRNKYRQSAADSHGDAIGAAPLERYYMSQSSMNAYDGTFGTWEQVKVTAIMPWGVWSFGMKDFPFGTGATLANNTRADEFLWVIPYGPFRILWGTWLSRGRQLESWATVPDGTTKNTLFTGGALTYDSGPMSAGVITIWRQFHQTAGDVPGGSGQTRASFEYADGYNKGAAATYPLPFDENTLVNVGFFKFNNGRFFANVEYAWANLDRYFLRWDTKGSSVDYPYDGSAPMYFEANHFFAEAGLFSGPAKLTLMYALASGSVLDRLYTQENGLWARSNPTKIYTGFPINYQAMEPYERLMFNTYAGGNNGGWKGPLWNGVKNGVAGPDVTFVADDHGMMSDAYCFAGRLDYAVAANLNLYASYIWAHRLERSGFLNGGIQDTGNGSSHSISDVTPGEFLAQAIYGGSSATTRFCPDGYLGWEANFGCDWKLLEGLTFKARYSYWKPGQWFDYAYQAWSTVPGTTTVSDGLVVKNRDAINAFECDLLVEF